MKKTKEKLMSVKIMSYIFVSIFLLSASKDVFANGVKITGPVIQDQSASKTVIIDFGLTWYNSWRVLNDVTDSKKDFRDAVWVFIKYKSSTGTEWKHGKLGIAEVTSGPWTNPTNYSAGTGTPSEGLDIIVPKDQLGAFIERKERGQGTVDRTDVQLVWDWCDKDASNNCQTGLTKDSQVTVQVFAIEMAYISEGSYKLGSGVQAETSTFYEGGTSFQPFTMPAESVTINLTNSSQNLYFANGGTHGVSSSGTPSGNIAPEYPKGYMAFYVMKYELSQGAYRDFLNNLTNTQQGNRVANNSETGYALLAQGTPPNRNGIRKKNGKFICDLSQNAVGGDASDGDTIAMNYLSWMDLAAYADWAGLRPMTELEFEKAARGPLPQVANEFAWGNNKIVQTAAVVKDFGKESEYADLTGDDGVANVNGTGSSGPLRSGFAAASNTSRLEAGASFYGIMDLSGNLWEQTVAAGNADAIQRFKGTHGDGQLSNDGFANLDWPGNTQLTNYKVDTASGGGIRGGSFLNTSVGVTKSNLNVSDREKANVGTSSRVSDIGGRCVRTAP